MKNIKFPSRAHKGQGIRPQNRMKRKRLPKIMKVLWPAGYGEETVGKTTARWDPHPELSLAPEPASGDEGGKKGKEMECKVAVPGWDTPKGRKLPIFNNAPVVDISSSEASRDDGFQAWVENGYRDPEPAEEPEAEVNGNTEELVSGEVAPDPEQDTAVSPEPGNPDGIEDHAETQETQQEYYIGNKITIPTTESEPLGYTTELEELKNSAGETVGYTKQSVESLVEEVSQKHDHRAQERGGTTLADLYSYNISFTGDTQQFTATCDEFPNLTQSAETPAEALTLIMEAVSQHIEHLKESGEALPEPNNLVLLGSSIDKSLFESIRHGFATT